MFIIQKKNNKKILVNKNSLKHPKLIKIEKTKDEAGNTENIYYYDIYIDIDKRHAIEKNLQTIEIVEELTIGMHILTRVQGRCKK